MFRGNKKKDTRRGRFTDNFITLDKHGDQARIHRTEWLYSYASSGTKHPTLEHCQQECHTTFLLELQSSVATAGPRDILTDL